MAATTSPAAHRYPSAPASQGGVDPRGLRLSAAVTTAVLAVVLLTGSTWLLAAQAVVFALAAFVGPQASPYGWLYRRLVRPRLGPPDHLEDPRPPRFAQLVGLVFALVGLLGALVGAHWLFLLAAGGAFAAALLNATTGICLGCEVYLRALRLRARTSA